MLALSFRFPAGRYHATPWGHHVNEGEVEWPPDLWRLTRALIAVWHRKLDPSLYPEGQLRELLVVLTGQPPVYRLPAATHAHTRHFMPGRRFGPKPNDRDMVFDAFARVDPDDPVVMAWPELDIEPKVLPLLDDLLATLGYLGRAESWVEATRAPDWPEWEKQVNCRPGEKSVDRETGEVLGEVVTLSRPRTPEEYTVFRDEVLEQLDDFDVSSYQRRAIEATLPEEWLDALRTETGELQKAGWDKPPAAKIELYVRPDDALKPPPRSPRRTTLSMPKLTTARFAVYGKPLPRLEDAVKTGELLRAAVMGRAKREFGEEDIPPLLAGHDLPDDHQHGHAFYLPEDADGDGRIDHLVIHVANGLSREARRTLGDLTRLWSGEGQEWRLVLEDIHTRERFTEVSSILRSGRVWQSVTPYLHPWHVKKKFTVTDQIRKECGLRELPGILQLRRVSEVRVGGRPRRPTHFRRIRSKRGLAQPDTHGSFWRIIFEEPVGGPLALGFGCHFGLGMFQVREEGTGGEDA